MRRLVILSVVGSFWTVFAIDGLFSVTKESEKGVEDVRANYASLDGLGVKFKRAVADRVIPEVHKSRVNHEEVEVSSFKRAEVYWKDNPETFRLRQDQPEPTITRVIHHGIYPSLNVTEPIWRANSSRIKSRTKRDWIRGNAGKAGSRSTVTDFRYSETGTSSTTSHQESTFQVKNGTRTVVDRRKNQDSSVHTAYLAQYPANGNPGVQSYPNINPGVPNYPNYNSRVQNPPQNNARVQSPPNNMKRPGIKPWVRTTTPGNTMFVRARRESGIGNANPSNSRDHQYRYNSTSSSNGVNKPQAAAHFQNGTASIYRKWENQNGTVKTTYQAQYPPYNFRPNSDFTGNFSYLRALHPNNASRDYSFYTHQVEQPTGNRTNSTTKYRTLYYPESNSVDSLSYKGDTANKGNVRLISVGYYSVNDSREGLRSYNNPPGRGREGLSESPRTNGFEPSRYKRDAGSWEWFDKLMVSIGLAKLENAQEMPAGSETVKLEVGGGGNEVLQNQYGYSSNGHHHVLRTQIDQIYLVGSAAPTTTTSSPFYAAALIAGSQDASDALEYEEISDTEELQELLPLSTPQPETPSIHPTSSNTKDLPNTGPVLIQAPIRYIDCAPGMSFAKGRCRRIWRSKG